MSVPCSFSKVTEMPAFLPFFFVILFRGFCCRQMRQQTKPLPQSPEIIIFFYSIENASLTQFLFKYTTPLVQIHNSTDHTGEPRGVSPHS